MAGDLSIKDPDAVTIDEPITWVAPTLTFFCREACVELSEVGHGHPDETKRKPKKDPFI